MRPRRSACREAAARLELGVGGNTPAIVKCPFWRRVSDNPQAAYAGVNLGEAITHPAIAARSMLPDADIDAALADLLGESHE